MKQSHREFWFIRHGESESNAGKPSTSDELTPLTMKGLEQSNFTASLIDTPPDLIIISPYFRAAQTAKPTLEKFPNIPSEVWPIQEYTYLPHALYQGTTSRQRSKPSIKYFYEANPQKILGSGAESFNQFIQRVQNTLYKLKQREEKLIILFGHGWFFRAMLWHLYISQKTEKERKIFLERIGILLPNSNFFLWLTHWFTTRFPSRMMQHFLLFSSAVKTPNCSIIKLSLGIKNDYELTGFSLNHLPPNLRKTKLGNR